MYNDNILWFYNFKKKNGFCIRNITHKSRELKKDAQEQTISFFKHVFNIRREFNIYDNINQIGNMEETAIY